LTSKLNQEKKEVETTKQPRQQLTKQEANSPMQSNYHDSKRSSGDGNGDVEPPSLEALQVLAATVSTAASAPVSSSQQEDRNQISQRDVGADNIINVSQKQGSNNYAASPIERQHEKRNASSSLGGLERQDLSGLKMDSSNTELRKGKWTVSSTTC
jgi:hypothetical protein